MARDDSKLVPIFNATNLETIPVADKHPADGGEVKQLTHAEYKEEFKCEYSEDMWVLPELAAKAAKKLAEGYKPTADEEKLLDRLKNPLKCLLIVKGDKIGNYLITTEPIKKGTVVGIYAGNFYPGKIKLEPKDDYALEVNKTMDYVTAYRRGGLLRFLPDLPADQKKLEEEIGPQRAKSYSFLAQEITFHSPKEWEELAFSNLSDNRRELLGISVCSFTANSDIPAGHVLGFPYCMKYDSYPYGEEILPHLLKKQGAVINRDRYHFSPQGKNYKTLLNNNALHYPAVWEQAWSTFDAGYHIPAEEHFINLLGMFKALNYNSGCAQALLGLAACRVQLRKFDLALAAWQQAETYQKKLESKGEKLPTWTLQTQEKVLTQLEYQHSLNFFEQKQFKLAGDKLLTTGKEFLVQGNSELQAYSLYLQSSCLLEEGNISGALAALDQAAAAFDQAATAEFRSQPCFRTKLSISVQAAISSGTFAASAFQSQPWFNVSYQLSTPYY